MTAERVTRGPVAPSADSEDGETSSGITRALKVIFAVAESPEPDVGVSELARTLGYSKTVVHRVVRTLVASGFFLVDERTRRYRLGPGAVSVGLAALARMEVPSIAQPHMERLVAATAETATLSARYGDQRMYLAQVLSPQEIRMAVPLGQLFPLHVGGSSKAILASLAPDELAAYLDRALAGTVSVTSREELEEQLRKIRRRGYAVSRGERQVDAGSVAAPVFDATGRVYGALSICGPVGRISDDKIEEYGTLVTEAAAAVSTGLGYRRTGA
ncbi:IclR family transcriptional regulator [Actinophytocola sp. KF-1]